MAMESLRSRARILMWLVTVPATLLSALALMQLWFIVRIGVPGLPMIVTFAPMYVYIWAMWMVRQALSAIARGAMFDEVVPRLLLRVGLALFFGALFNVFGVPAVSMLFKFRGPFGFFDGAAVTLGVVGATLVLLSQLLRHAASMREELDSFF